MAPVAPLPLSNVIPAQNGTEAPGIVNNPGPSIPVTTVTPGPKLSALSENPTLDGTL